MNFSTKSSSRISSDSMRAWRAACFSEEIMGSEDSAELSAADDFKGEAFEVFGFGQVQHDGMVGALGVGGE